ncbi:MAG: DNA polymerase III subunit [bacterium]
MDYLDEIIGQDTVKEFLRSALRKDRIYNLLFAGPRGVGKRQTAFALIKSLGCPLNSPNFMLIAPVVPGVKDDKISEYMKNYLPEHPLVPLEDNASIIIKQIRKLIEWLMLMPAKKTKRVVIILEADRMNEEAANSFLKTLEEPPIDTIFILTSSRPDYLMPTIRSRCQLIHFSYLSNTQIQNIIFEDTDFYRLGSPGEILTLKENTLFEIAREIFRKAPLSPSSVAKFAREMEKERLIDLFYGLLLLYRNALYIYFNGQRGPASETDFIKKIQRLNPNKIINTLNLLNNSINLLKNNPNHLLLLINTLLKLP